MLVFKKSILMFFFEFQACYDHTKKKKIYDTNIGSIFSPVAFFEFEVALFCHFRWHYLDFNASILLKLGRTIA